LEYLIAIDGGGTTCRALLADAGGRVLGRGQGGAANIMTDPDGALASIIAAAESACEAAGISSDILAAAGAALGLAGANVGGNGERMRARLPFARSIVVSDAVIAMHGALGAHDGVVAILGTGSVFVARDRGSVRMIGGWGFKVSDLASGARLGRSLLEETLLAHDGVREGSRMTAETLAHFDGNPDRIVEFAHSALPRDYGTFAPRIFAAADAGDKVALRILDEAVTQISEALEAIMPAGGGRLCLLGGLAPLYEEWLRPRYGVILHKPLGGALDGALLLAMQSFSLVTGGGSDG